MQHLQTKSVTVTPPGTPGEGAAQHCVNFPKTDKQLNFNNSMSRVLTETTLTACGQTFYTTSHHHFPHETHHYLQTKSGRNTLHAIDNVSHPYLPKYCDHVAKI